MKKIHRQIALPLLSLLIAFPLWADEPHTLVYGAYQHAPWLIINDTDGKPQGVTPTYIAEAERRAPDLDIDLEPMPFQRALVNLKDGKVDIVASTDHPSLRVFAEKVAPFGPLKMALYTKAPIEAETLSDLPPMAVGYLRGLPLSKPLAMIEALDWVRVNSERSGFAAVDLGRLDAAVFPELSYRYHAAHNEWTHGELHKALFLGDETVYAWTQKGRGDEPAIQRLREVMQGMTEDGTGEALMTGVGVDLGLD
ncbi:MAG: substrate-binding periplasmic protein [Pseudomonadota bacterium]